jgi:hypothetical protein
MKSAVLARPNLKLFLLGAILIALIQNFIANGHSQGTVLHARSPVFAPANAELGQLLAEAENDPSSQLYTRISRCYERQGDIRRALLYLRKAQLIAQTEDSPD